MRWTFRCVASIISVTGGPSPPRQMTENPVENTHLGPAPKPVVERLVRTVFARGILPLEALLEYEDNARNHTPVINPRHAVRVGKNGSIFDI